MGEQEIIRAWKDRRYRLGLSDRRRAELPDNPAGAVELPDEQLLNVAGAAEEAMTCLYCLSHSTITCCEEELQ